MWTYDLGLTKAKDQIRLLIGDTESTDPLLQDEEITFHANGQSGLYRQAAACARAIAGTFSRRVDRSVGQLKLSSGQQAKAYHDLAQSLMRQAARQDAVPYAGGLSISDKEGVEDNTDRVKPAFTRETGDVPGTTLMDNFDTANANPP